MENTKSTIKKIELQITQKQALIEGLVAGIAINPIRAIEYGDHETILKLSYEINMFEDVLKSINYYVDAVNSSEKHSDEAIKGLHDVAIRYKKDAMKNIMRYDPVSHRPDLKDACNWLANKELFSFLDQLPNQ